MNVIHNVMHFISGVQPTPSIPTGDVMTLVVAILGFAFLTATLFMLAHVVVKKSVVETEKAKGALSIFATNKVWLKLLIVVTSIFVIFAVSYTVSHVIAFAEENANTQKIDVVVDEQAQTVVSSNSKLFNESTNTQKIYSVEVYKNDEIADIEGINDVTLKVESNGDILFNDKVGAGHLLTDEITLEAGETAELSYSFEGLPFDLATKLIDKDAINVDVTLQNMYSVTYNANGATSGSVPPAQIKYAEQDLILAQNTGLLEKTHYNITGWNTQADGSGTHYDFGATYQADTDLVLYAQWIEKTARITYKVDSAQSTFGTVKLNSGGAASSSVYEEIGELTGVPAGATAQALGSYKFVSWTENDPSGQTASTQANFTPQKPTTGWADITYYANFTSANMAIVFQTSDTSQGVVYPSHIEADQSSITYNYDTTTGNMIIGGKTVGVYPSAYYHFKSWYIGDQPAPSSGTITKSTVFTLNFEKDKYDLTFSSADSTQGSVSPTSLADITALSEYSVDAKTGKMTIGSNTITVTPSDNYHFSHWTLDGAPIELTGVITKDSIFVANFEIDNYKVTFDTEENAHGTVTNAGTHDVPAGSTISVTGDTVTVRLNVSTTEEVTLISQGIPDSESYACIGWSFIYDGRENSACNDYPETEITEDLHLRAYFVENKVSLIFDVNDHQHCEITGAGAIDSKWAIEVPYGSWMKLVDNTLVVTGDGFDDITVAAVPKSEYTNGYHFDHWDSSIHIPDSGTKVTESTTFDATLLVNQYTFSFDSSDNVKDYISFNHQDITVNWGWTWAIDNAYINIKDPVTQEFKYIISANIADEVKNGFKFDNWQVDGGVTSGTITADNSFTANFSRQTYSISISSNHEDVVSLSAKTINDIPYGSYCLYDWYEGNYALNIYDPDSFIPYGSKELIATVSFECDLDYDEYKWYYGNTEINDDEWNAKQILGPQNFNLNVLLNSSYVEFYTNTDDIVPDATELRIENGNRYKLYEDKIEFTNGFETTTVNFVQNPEREGADIYAYNFSEWNINREVVTEPEGIVNDIDSIKFVYDRKTFDINIVSENTSMGTVDTEAFEDVEYGSRLHVNDNKVVLNRYDTEDEETVTATKIDPYASNGWTYGNDFLTQDYIVKDEKALTALFSNSTCLTMCTAYGEGTIDPINFTVNFKKYTQYSVSGNVLTFGTEDSLNVKVVPIPKEGYILGGWSITNEDGAPQPQTGFLQEEEMNFNAFFIVDPATIPVVNISSNDVEKGQIDIYESGTVSQTTPNIDLPLNGIKYYKIDEDNKLCVAGSDHVFNVLAGPNATSPNEFYGWQFYDFAANAWCDILDGEHTLDGNMKIRAFFNAPSLHKVTYKVADDCYDYGNLARGNNPNAQKVKEVTEYVEDSVTGEGAYAIEDNFINWTSEDGTEVSTEHYYPVYAPGLDQDIVFYAHFIVPKALYDDRTKTLKLFCDDTQIPENVNSEYLFDCEPTDFEIKDNVTKEISKKYPTWYYEDGTPKVYFEHVVIDPSFAKYQAIDSLSLYFVDSAIFLSQDYLFNEPTDEYFKSVFDNIENGVSNDVVDEPLDLYKPLNVSDITGLENIYTHNIKQTAFMMARRLSYIEDIHSGSYRRTDQIGKLITIVDPLTTLDLSTWTDMPYLEDITGMFAGRNGLNNLKLPVCTSVDGTEFGVQAKTMTGLFASCGSLREFDITGKFGENATNLNYMFTFCDNLRNVNIDESSTFGINATKFVGMFSVCSQLQKLNLTNFSVDWWVNADEMFSYCKELSVVKVSDNWKISFSEAGMPGEYKYYGGNHWYKEGENAWHDCGNVPTKTGSGTYVRQCPKAVYNEASKTLSFYYDHKDYDGQYFSVDATSNLFNFLYPDWYEKELYFNGNKITFNTGGFNSFVLSPHNSNQDVVSLLSQNFGAEQPEANLASLMDLLASLLQEIEYHSTCSIDARNVHFDDSFKDFDYLLTTSGWFAADSQGYQPYRTFEGFENINTSKLLMTNSMFGGFSTDGFIDVGLTLLGPIALNRMMGIWPEELPDFYKDYMPVLMPLLSTLTDNYDISTQDTYGTSIEYLDLSNFDKDHNLRSYSGMFANCTNLKTVILPKNILTEGWNGSNEGKGLSSFGCMFLNCKSLESIVNLNGAYGAQTSGLACCEKMFYGCENLASLDFTYFNTRNVIENMEGSIGEDENFNFAFDMFKGCNRLSTLILGKNWNLPTAKSGLIETADEGNPWVHDGEIYLTKNIPGLKKDDDGIWNPVTTGEFTRDPSLIREKVIHVNAWQEMSEDPLDKGGSVSVDKINFTGTITYSLNNYRLVINGQQVSATPDDGFALKYWAISDNSDEVGYKITKSFLADYLKTLDGNELYLHAVFGDPNVKAKAVYGMMEDPETHEDVETLRFVYDGEDYTDADGVEEVFDVEPNTYINPSFYLLTPFYISAFSGLCIPAQLPPWFDIEFINVMNLYPDSDELARDNSRILPLWDRFNDQDILPQIKWTISPKNVIFDYSFRDYRELQSISMWFMADQFGNQSIENFYSVDENDDITEGFASLNTQSLTNVQYAFGGMFYPYGFDVKRLDYLANEGIFGSIINGDGNSYALPGESYNRVLNHIDLTDFDFSHLKSMSYMFANNVGLQHIIFPDDIDTSKITDLNGLFANCENLGRNDEFENPIENIDKFKTNNVLSFEGTFYGCSNLTKLDLSGWVTENAYELDLNDKTESVYFNVCQDMLKDCNRLQEISITSSCAYVTELMPFNMHGWTFNLAWDCGLEDFGNPWFKKDTTSPEYYSDHIPAYSYYPLTDEDVVSGTFTKTPPTEYSVTFKVDDDDHGTVNGQSSTTYNFISSAAVKLDSDKTNILWSDNTVYEAQAKEGFRFKYWAYGDGFDISLQGQRVPEGQVWNWDDDSVEYSFVAVFEDASLTAKAVFSAVENVGTVKFVYDNQTYTPGTDNVVYVAAVEPKFDDYNLPSWYVATSESWHVGDNHRIPKFVPEIENSADNYSIEFDSSFAEYDELVSLSCWFMPAISNDNEMNLYSPFKFDSTNFKGLENINTSYVTNVAFMFGGHEFFNDYAGSHVTEINLNNFDLDCNITSLEAIFANCKDLHTISWESFNNEYITNLRKTFYNCRSLWSNDGPGFEDNIAWLKTGNVEDMSYCFAWYRDDSPTDEQLIDNLKFEFPESWTTTRVINMEGMFSGIKEAKQIEIVAENFYTWNVSNMKSMFALNYHLEDAHIMLDGAKGWNTSNVRDMSYMFADCNELKEFDFSNKPNQAVFNFQQVEDINHMFECCFKMKKFAGYIPTDTSNLIKDARYAFADCKNLTYGDFSCFRINSNILLSLNYPYSNMFTLHDESNVSINNNVLNYIKPLKVSGDYTYDITLSDAGISSYNQDGSYRTWLMHWEDYYEKHYFLRLASEMTFNDYGFVEATCEYQTQLSTNLPEDEYRLDSWGPQSLSYSPGVVDSIKVEPQDDKSSLKCTFIKSGQSITEYEFRYIDQESSTFEGGTWYCDGEPIPATGIEELDLTRNHVLYFEAELSRNNSSHTQGFRTNLLDINNFVNFLNPIFGIVESFLKF